MSRILKKSIAFLLLLCTAAAMLSVSPPEAMAEEAEIQEYSSTVEIHKVLSTISKTPVVLMPLSEIIPATSTEGCYVSDMTWYDGQGQVVGERFEQVAAHRVDIRIDAGAGYCFAEDVTAYLNNNKVTVNRDPSGSFITFSREYVPDVWAPTVIKHPGGETVDEGGWASFVATATYCNDYKWSLQSPDGKSSVDCADAPSKFPGLTTDEDGSTKMNLYNIPAELNGWKIRCTFSGPGGSSVSNGAKIVVRGAVAETPKPSPSPSPTPKPTAVPEEEKEEAHVHDFSGDWKYDDSGHWKECECGEKGEAGAHVMEWTVIREASKDSPGEETGRCSICGYTAKRELPYEKGTDKKDDDGLSVIKIVLIAAAGLVVLVLIILVCDYVRVSKRRKHRRSRRRY